MTHASIESSGDVMPQDSNELRQPKSINDLPDELLVEILSSIPPECRYKLRRVSHKWNDIVSEVGYHIEPEFVVSIGAFSYPSYRPLIRWNPVLDSCDGVLAQMFKQDMETLSRHQAEFIKSPPVSMVTMNGLDGCLRSATVLRTATSASKHPKGVLIGDILDLTNKVFPDLGFSGGWGNHPILTVGLRANLTRGERLKLLEPRKGSRPEIREIVDG